MDIEDPAYPKFAIGRFSLLILDVDICYCYHIQRI